MPPVELETAILCRAVALLAGRRPDRTALEALLVGDRNRLLLAVLCVGYGAPDRLRMTCGNPDCRAMHEVTFDVEQVLASVPAVGAIEVIEVAGPDGPIPLRLPTGADLTALAAEAVPAEALLKRCVKGSAFTAEYLQAVEAGITASDNCVEITLLSQPAPTAEPKSPDGSIRWNSCVARWVAGAACSQSSTCWHGAITGARRNSSAMPEHTAGDATCGQRGPGRQGQPCAGRHDWHSGAARRPGRRAAAKPADRQPLRCSVPATLCPAGAGVGRPAEREDVLADRRGRIPRHGPGAPHRCAHRGPTGAGGPVGRAGGPLDRRHRLAFRGADRPCNGASPRIRTQTATPNGDTVAGARPCNGTGRHRIIGLEEARASIGAGDAEPGAPDRTDLNRQAKARPRSAVLGASPADSAAQASSGDVQKRQAEANSARPPCPHSGVVAQPAPRLHPIAAVNPPTPEQNDAPPHKVNPLAPFADEPVGTDALKSDTTRRAGEPARVEAVKSGCSSLVSPTSLMA